MSIISSKKGDKWILESPIAMGASIIAICSVIFTAGFFIGDLKKSLEARMEIYELKQDCNEKVQKVIIECAENRQKEEDRRILELEVFIKELKDNKVQNGKN